MKRTAIIFITTIYLLSCLGVAVNSFYCCGMLKSTSVLYNGAAKPINCKMKGMAHKCCKTKKQYLKVKDQHFASATFNLNFSQWYSFIPGIFKTSIKYPINFTTYLAFNSHAPPGDYQTARYILNCTFKI